MICYHVSINTFHSLQPAETATETGHETQFHLQTQTQAGTPARSEKPQMPQMRKEVPLGTHRRAHLPEMQGKAGLARDVVSRWIFPTSLDQPGPEDALPSNVILKVVTNQL